MKTINRTSVYQRPSAVPRVCHHSCHRHVPSGRLARRVSSAAIKDPDSYAAEATDRLLLAEASGDWLAAFEVLTEASVMQAPLPPLALEGGIRTLAQGGQWQRSADLMDKVLAAGGPLPHATTVLCVFKALAQGKQAGRAQAMLELMITRGAGADILHPAQNIVVRALARSGQALEAYTLLESMVSGQGIMQVDSETFPCVCNELLKAGEGAKAEEVLEWRDFLSGDD